MNCKDCIHYSLCKNDNRLNLYATMQRVCSNFAIKEQYSKPTKEVANMRISRAIAIFCNINSNDYPDEDKAIAIYKVLKMPTHNGIKKSAFVEAAKWLLNKSYYIEEAE